MGEETITKQVCAAEVLAWLKKFKTFLIAAAGGSMLIYGLATTTDLGFLGVGGFLAYFAYTYFKVLKTEEYLENKYFRGKDA